MFFRSLLTEFCHEKKAASVLKLKKICFCVTAKTFRLILNPKFLSGLVALPSGQDFTCSEALIAK